MNAKMTELKKLLESIAAELELSNSSDTEKAQAYSEIGSIVANVIPFGSITSVLAGIADAGPEYSTDPIENAISSIKEAEAPIWARSKRTSCDKGTLE